MEGGVIKFHGLHRLERYPLVIPPICHSSLRAGIQSPWIPDRVRYDRFFALEIGNWKLEIFQTLIPAHLCPSFALHGLDLPLIGGHCLMRRIPRPPDLLACHFAFAAKISQMVPGISEHISEFRKRD